MPANDIVEVPAGAPAPSVVVTIHPEKCIGAGYCVEEAADVFAQDDDDGMVVLLVSNPSPERKAAVLNAARRCPVMAIEIRE
ncbi:ferredoxin-2 domain protein [Paraburkholderia xenovorans LB400]|uniref:Ferredoxin n=1 Tax=Paraburkholderia xenovorans (strain LB400) TaxID=266265 RepID=Q13GH0_PARXL|nr:ferredoxin [Paraburkholderia xenovorans]ABE36819.1 Putative ferredoxin [Paraburkholderia xenovorans LB400]AIP34635.1 ferredoxin-2 domain protein [Paraburkholderia xenovorans LB400]